jgi:hypothetical protein
MRRSPLFTVIAAAGLAAAVTAVPAHAATINPGISMWSRPAVSLPVEFATCPTSWDLSRPDAIYQVKGTGVEVRISPGGAASSAIPQSTSFASEWVVNHEAGYQCIATADGRTWVLGVSESGAVGWLAAEYLSPLTGLSNMPD